MAGTAQKAAAAKLRALHAAGALVLPNAGTLAAPW